MPLHAETLLFAAIAIRAAFVVIFIANAHKRRKQTYLLNWFASPAFALAALLGAAAVPDFPRVSAWQGFAIAGLLGVSFSLCWAGLRDLLGDKTRFVAILALGLVPGALFAAGAICGRPDTALAAALFALAALAARPIRDLLPAYWRERQSSQFFVLAALAFYATAFGAIGARVLLRSGEELGGVATLALIADCLFSILLLVNFLAITGEQARRSLRNLATTDTLTGLLNRRGFLKVAEKALTRRDGSACVVIADIDHFKAINDRFGHDGGDVVLAEFARRCRSVVQGPHDLLARWGGEEFVMLLPGICVTDAQAYAEAVRAAVSAKPFKVFGESCNVTVSAGIAQMKTDEQSVEFAIGRADVALYRAKNEGRDRVCLARAPDRSVAHIPANDSRLDLKTVAGASIPLAPATASPSLAPERLKLSGDRP